jgi:hypothetical protein
MFRKKGFTAACWLTQQNIFENRLEAILVLFPFTSCFAKTGDWDESAGVFVHPNDQVVYQRIYRLIISQLITFMSRNHKTSLQSATYLGNNT